MYTHRFRPQISTLHRLLVLCLWLFAGHYLVAQNPSFSASGLIGENINNPTSLQFGPDNRLYIAQQDGLVFAYTIERQGVNQYVITSTETIDLIQKHVPNHNDDGSSNGTKQRQVTSILVVGTAQNPVLYVASSDWRISVGVDSDLDTNSGVITRLTWIGNGINDPSGYWDKVDIVRGLPRSEENHATNGMQIDLSTNTLYVMQGGHTNKGAPSNNFAQTPEFALSAALLSIDLNAIEAMPVNGSGFDQFIYDIPTLDDPTRGVPGQPDPGDPFGGNDGRNQARIVVGGPVQVYSPGFRNAYDVVLTQNGRLYTFDNGPNGSWGGVSLNCSNQSSEVNDTGYGDGLHFISGPGYYGGHPNYTRANPENSGLFIYEKVGGIWTQTAAYDWITDFPDPPVPLSMANPTECDYLIPAIENQALAIVNASTNGITEYRASNFNNALKGNILAASFSGDIFSYELNASGDAVVSQKSLFSGFGSQPLDVTTQGDGEIFAGTVWAATYGSNSIMVFEPNDFITCTGTYSTELDDDFDNYSNADEVDNGSDPCSAGSKPADRDLDYISDLNDPDDDNDGILDVVDAFAIDAENGLSTFLPIHYDLFNYDPGEGFFGLGFTGLMQNGGTDYLDQFDASNLAAGGAAGLLTIEEVPEGDAFQTKNTQEYAFQFGLNVKMENGPFSIKVRMNGPFLGDTPSDSASQGIYIGTGSQKDYLKFVLTTENGGGIQVTQEANDVATSTVSSIPNILSATFIDLIIDIEPASGVYVTRYIVDGGNEITLGGGLLNNSIAYAVQSESQALAVGLVATSTGPASPFSATWDRIDVTGSGPTKTQIPDVEAAVGDLEEQINLHAYFEDNAGDENLTYYVTENTSTGISSSIASNNLVLNYPATPDSGRLTIKATDSDGYFVEQSFDVFLRTERIVLYRVNAGGGMKDALDDEIAWDADTAENVSPYHDGNSNINGFDITFFDASIPSTTPLSIFDTERWDPVATPEMNWEFPAEISGIYEVRLYFANGFGGTSSPGQRVFHVMLEGDTLLKDYDIAADVGHLTGVCKKLLVPVTDGNLNIEFLHITENPLVNAIEILGPASSETNLEAAPTPLHFFSQQIFSTSAPQALTLQNNGARAITINSVEISGVDSAMFAHSFGGVFTIQPGGSQNINVTFSPTSEGLKGALLTITHDADNNPLEINLTGEAILGGQQVLFRVNAGGPQVAAADTSDPDWSQDDANGVSPYLSGVTNIYGVGDSIALHPTVPSSAPMSMFQIERWGPDPTQPMQWDFPIPAGTPVEVRLYFAETFLTAQSNENSARIFDIEIDGTIPSIFDGLNIFEEVGHDVGIMKAFQTTSDGNLDIDFLHSANNPAVKGIEIIDLSTPVENLRPELLATDDQTNDEQDLVSLQIVAQDSDGDTLAYSATDLPPGLTINSSTGLISGVVSDVAALGSPYETIIFVNDGNNPAVSDTIIWTINAPGLPTDICINTGGGEYTSNEGKVFLADDYFSSNTGFFSTNQPIDNTVDDELYQSERYGIDFNYSIPLADGTYIVDLHFAEIYHGVNNGGGVNSRVFSVDIEGSNALSNYDIFSTADIDNGDPSGNGELYAIVETFQVTVSGGTLDIRLYKGAGGSDNAKISAICAYPTAPNNPPVVQNPGDQENTVGDDVRLLIGASDDEGDILMFSAIGLPLGLNIDPDSGLISGVIDAGAVNGSPYSVTVSVNDGNNSPVTVSFNWNILSNNSPIVSNPGNQVNTEGDAVSLAIMATDDENDILTYNATNLPPGLSIHPSTGIISGTISDGADENSPYTVSVFVSDGVNADVAVTFTWFVEPLNSPPIVTNPGNQVNTEGDNISLNITASDVDNDDLTFGATGLPTGVSIDEETGVISGTIANNTSDNSPYTVQISVDDGFNPIVYVAFDWYINDNLPPVVSTPNDQQNIEGDIVNLAITATDPENDAISYQANNLPLGLSINPGTGVISGTVDTGAATNSPYTVEVTVADGINPAVMISFTWTIEIPNQSPVVATPDDQTNEEGDVVSLAINASDPDGDDLTYVASGLPTGLSIDINSGLISGTVAEGAAANSPYTVAITVNDGENPAVVVSFDWTIEIPNRSPVVATPDDQTNEEGDVVSLAINASDPDGDDLTYVASGLPTGLGINVNTGLISGTVAEGAADNSPYTVNITVNDGVNPAVVVSFDWTIEVPNQSPIVATPDDQTNEEGDVVSLAINASDPDGDDLTYVASGLPTGLGININTGLISGTVAEGAADNSPYTVNITVNDGVNPAVVVSFDWTIEVPNQSPIVATPDDQTNEEGDVVSLAINASDPDGDDLTYVASGLPTGLGINVNTALISGTVAEGAADNSPYTVNITVNDGVNPAVVVSFDWTIEVPNQSPIVATPDDQTNEEGDVVSLAINASDPDGDDLTYVASGLPTGLGINVNTGLISGTVAEGAADNSPYTVNITVNDGVNPAVVVSFNWYINPITIPSAFMTINNGNGIGASTYGNNSFLITNNSNNGLKLSHLIIDISTSILPDLVFDPVGAAGDVVGKCFTANNGAVEVGVVMPSDACVDPFSSPRDGGYDVMSIDFSDFDPTESFGFSVDIDPTSIQGATGSGVAGSISGLELSGATIWAVFENGDTIKAETYYGGTSGSSQVCLQAPVTQAPNIEVINLPTPNIPRKSEVEDANQTIRISGPSGARVALLIVEAGLFLSEVNGNGFDIDPFEGNQALNVREFNTTIGQNGIVNIPISLTKADHPEWETGLNHLMAVIKDSVNCISYTSDVWVLKYVPNEPPIISEIADQQNTEGEDVQLTISASDPENAALLFSAQNLPPGLYINDATGVISGTIDNNASVNSPYTVQISVDDGHNPLVYQSFEWYIIDNLPPVVTTPNDQQNTEGDAVSLSIVAMDSEGDVLNYQASNLPAGLTINQTSGVISGTVDAGAAANSPYVVSISVSDDLNPSVVVSFNWTIEIPNQSPVVATPDDQANEEGDAVSLIVNANDPDGDNLTYVASGLPTGLSIDINTGLISGTIAEGASNNSPYTVAITVNDGVNPAVVVSFNWYINPITIPSAFMTINSGGGIGASTYGNNSFMITNNSNNGLKLSHLIIDISTSILPDLVFDPVGAAGDVVGKCFTANNGAVDVGVVMPSDACVDPFSSPRDGGYDVMSIDFSDFDPTESFGFSVDIDPTSIQGATGSGVAGSISGLELSGATIWAVFENGDTIKAEAYYGGTDGSSNVCLEAPISPAPIIEILNLPAPVIPRSSEVEDTNQTIRINGPSGADVALLVVEAGLFLSEVNGNGFDIDPFEGNQALNVREFNTTIGANGMVDIPITLNRTTHPEWETGFNYLMAVIKDDEDCTSYTSDVWVLKVEENEPPIISSISNQQNSEWESVQLTLYASDPENDPLTFTADNLPDGLSINQMTGLISGIVAPGASLNSPYEVTISVSDGTNTVEQSFLWAIGIQPCIAPEVIGFVMVNSDLDIDVGTITDGDTIRLQDLTYAFTLRAAACGFLPDSVVMELSGDTIHKKTEGFAPYALFGDFSGDYQPWPATPGEYTITATPYTNYNGQVYGGAPLSIDVVIVDEPNLPPTIYNISTQFGYEWQSTSLSVFATDPNEDPLTYRASNLPPGLRISSRTGQIRGRITPGASNNSPYLVTVAANDGYNPDVTESFYWVVGTQACVGPTVQSFTLLNATANTEMYALADGDTIDLADFDHTLSVLANTCGLRPDEVVMTLGGDTTHTRVEVNAPYTLFGGINGNHEPWPVTPGEYIISATPYRSFNGVWGEGEGISIRVIVINSTPVNDPPTLAAIRNQSNFEGDTIAIQAIASDPDGDLLTFGATGLPLGLSINSTTGSITGIIQAGASAFSPYSTTVYVSDGQEVVFQNFVWQVDRLIPGCEQPKVLDFYLVNADLDVDMYTLQDGDTIDLGQIANGINIRADICGITPDSLVITVVEDTLHYQSELTAPYSVYGDLAGDYYPWNASAGNYYLTATPYIGGAPVGEAKSINFNVINGQVCIGDILLVVGNVILSEGDQAAKDRLEELGFSVTVMHAEDAQTADALNKSLVMISSTVFSVHVGDKFSDVGVPVMCWEAYLYDELGLTGPQINTDYQFANFQTTVDVVDPLHPMAAGLSGMTPVLDGLHTMPWGKPNRNAEVIATHPEQPSQAVLFGYETGARMVGRTAQARRVGIFLHSNSTNYLNENGWKLFDNAVFWALDCENQDANLFPTIEITSPADRTTYSSLDTLSITANAQDPDGSLNSVSFYVNGDFIGIDPEFPYEVPWIIPSYGVYVIEAIATGEEGETATSRIRIEAVEPESCQGDVLMVVGNGLLGTGDLLIKQRLESMGFAVQTLNDNGAQPGHALRKDLVIISSSVASWEVGTKFKDVAVPVINYEAFLYDDMGMTGPVEASDYYWAFDQTYLVINDPSHPMAAGYTGFVWTYTTPESFIWGNPSPSAFKVASIIGATNKHAIFGYEAGSPMVGMNAPARRVGLFTQASGIPYMTTGAWNLFESAVYWAIGCSQSTSEPSVPNPFSRKVAAEPLNTTSSELHTKVYPNPAAGNSTLYVEHEASGPVYVQISDMVGKVHYETTISKESYSIEMELPTENLANGSYVIQIVHSAFSKSERLIKIAGK